LGTICQRLFAFVELKKGALPEDILHGTLINKQL